jgi:hypothetical protein
LESRRKTGRLAGELLRLHDEICPESGHAAFRENVKDYRIHWRAVSSILSHPWFCRRWIIQEAVLGHCKYFMWGSYSLAWKDFVPLTRDLESPTISDRDRGKNRIEDDKYGLEVLGALDFAQKWIKSKRQTSEPTETTVTDRQTWEDGTLSTSSTVATTNVFSDLLSLERLLEMFSTGQVSDDRDLVYSLIALAADVDEEHWFPDYSQENTSAAVFMKALRHIIATNQDIDVLCRSVVFRPGSPLPSASDHNPSLPKLDRESCTNCGLRNRYLNTFTFPVWDGHTPPVGNGPTKVYSASGQIPHYCIVSADTMDCPSRSGPHLQVEVLGFHIDTIREVDEFDEGDSVIPLIGGNEGVSRAGLRMVLKRRDSHCSTAGSNHQWSTIWRDVPEAFWRSLCGNRDYHSDHITDMPVEWIRVMQEVYAIIIALNRLEYCTDSLSEPDASYVTNQIEGYQEARAKAYENEAWMQIRCTMNHVVRNRRFALTEKSMGFVPHGAKSGMPIYILQGCSVPVVLRQCSDCHGPNAFNLVGDCYIDGVMEGELMSRIRDMVPEKIVLH